MNGLPYHPAIPSGTLSQPLWRNVTASLLQDCSSRKMTGSQKEDWGKEQEKWGAEKGDKGNRRIKRKEEKHEGEKMGFI